MERLHIVRALFLLIGFFLAAFHPLAAQGKCSLVVRVLTPDGQRPEAPILVQEKNGRTIDKDQRNRDVDFCDLGVLPVTVRVGSSGMCNQVTVENVPISWNKTYLLRVTYDPLACPGDAPRSPSAVCHTLFRVTDQDGKWISGATIKINVPKSVSLKTDQFGRVLFPSGVGVGVHGSVDMIGYDQA